MALPEVSETINENQIGSKSSITSTLSKSQYSFANNSLNKIHLTPIYSIDGASVKEPNNVKSSDLPSGQLSVPSSNSSSECEVCF